MSKTAHIIIGLGFGDEGKGLVSDYYCSRLEKPIVIRFNGGQQAGHTVFIKPGQKHMFSNLGVGACRGIPTYWSEYCSFSPGFFLDEVKALRQPVKFFLDRNCPVTTHYDILYNRLIEHFGGKKRHGSCGLGVGSTFQRHKELKIKFTAEDLLDANLSLYKLSLIRKYYRKKIQKETDFLFYAFNHNREDARFEKLLQAIGHLIVEGSVVLTNESRILRSDSSWKSYIFEGAQGILLDQKFGQQPYVTRSNTTSQNAIELIERNFQTADIKTTLVYVTRAYHTRHGNGPFKSANSNKLLKNTFYEFNEFNSYQGPFKVGYLDLDLLNYSVKCDRQFSKAYQKNLFVTCLDQVNPANIPVYIDGRKRFISFEMIQALVACDLECVHYSFSPFSSDIQ
ncbi:MAG: hypothetical protein EOP48_26505 [Sphingobacteriales bacterium]|nr:MAG: hypothetical protein EOP48_26505 [Sphingobacteriales bacterium]